MDLLTVGPTWSAQIDAIRNAHTEDTNLGRFGNTYYRICSPGARMFDIQLQPSTHAPGRPLRIQMGSSDLYVASLDGNPFERYASTANDLVVGAAKMDGAIRSVVDRKVSGDRAFLDRSMLVFCVAESLRNDHFATALDMALRASTVQIKGVEAGLKLQHWWDLAHAWGRASDAIIAMLTPRAREIVLRPRAALTPQERQFSERVDVERLPSDLRECGRTLKVLKRPG